jgi:hypothetical protein
MAKNKISEFDVNPDNNTDINSINIAEGCAPSGINNAIRQLMSDLKEQQTGASGDPFTVGGAFVASGTFAANGGATLGDASGDALTINSSAVSIPNGLNFDSNTFVIDAANNNVGIGTSSPAYRLQVNNKIAAVNTSGESSVHVVNSTSDVYMFNSFSTNTFGFYDVTAGRALQLYDRANDNWQFYTNNLERMRITNAGNVGIGTSTPTFTSGSGLFVERSGGTAAIEVNRSDASIAGSISLLGGSVQNNIYSVGAKPLVVYTDSAERMRITSSGNVGIGTSSPSDFGSTFKVLQVAGSSFGVIQATSTSGSTTVEMMGSSGTGLIGTRTNHPLVLRVNDSEKVRIGSDASLTTNGGYFGFSVYTNKRQMQFSYPTSGFQANNDATDFFTAGNGSALAQMRVSATGNVGCRGSFSGGQTLNDYAEYFEWSDSNPSNEDRIGVTVVLDNGQIRPSTQSDVPSSSIGVVSGTAGVVLGSAPFEWSGKYQRDEFGRIKTYAETWINWSDESGNHNYKQGEVPSDVVVPDTAEIRTYEKQLLSENYDESVEYANREHRPEWACIGLVGQVHVKKGQVVGDRWIKMKDISENVEMWFIR